MLFGKRKHHSESEESPSTFDTDDVPAKRMRTEDSSSNGETDVTTRESSPTLTDTAEEEENEVLRIILPDDGNTIAEQDAYAEAETVPENESLDSGSQLEEPAEDVANDEPTNTVDQEESSSPAPLAMREFFLGPPSPSWPLTLHPTFTRSSPSPSEEEDAPSPTGGNSPTVAPEHLPQAVVEGDEVVEWDEIVEEDEVVEGDDDDEETILFGLPWLIVDDTDEPHDTDEP